MPARLAAEFAALVTAGRSPLLVSSGATAIGLERLGFERRPTELPLLQAAASAGQSVLMRRYDEAFSAHGLTVAQVLLTHSDLSNRGRLNNARATLAALLDAGAVPIINENDVVATEELRFSDNDQLAGMVAPLVSADALILLSDVDGVLDEAGARIPLLDTLEAFQDRGQNADRIGRGGMKSKLDSAVMARRSGALVVIANAAVPGIIGQVLAGADVGTCIGTVAPTLRARHHWIAYTLRPRGTLLVDRGAAEALRKGGSSLLLVGVVGLRGEFRRGDSVRIVDAEGVELARGLSRLSTLEVARAAGKKGEELAAVLGGSTDGEVVHKDDLVLEQ
jgi:glutamate 5-kinase